MLADIGHNTISIDLDLLAASVRTGLSKIRTEMRNALRAALDIGDALVAARELVVAKTESPGAWGRWLRANCFLSVRTAQLYIQLANHRTEIEAEIQRVADLSLRAARRLIAPPKEKTPKPEKLLPTFSLPGTRQPPPRKPTASVRSSYWNFSA